VSFLSGVWGGAPAKIEFNWCILALKDEIWWQ